MAGIRYADDLGNARELLAPPPSKQERTAHRTQCIANATRLLFLFSHGTLVMCVSAHLDNLAEASWGLMFLPVWIGDGTCFVLLILSWFASCPYIRQCLTEKALSLGTHNPSILTEVLPEIVLAFLGAFFVLLIFAGEYALYAYLDSEQRGEPYSLVTSVLLISFVAILTICHGVCLVDDSVLFLAVGLSLLATIVLFAATREAEALHQAASLAPVAIAVACLLVAGVMRFATTRKILSREERILRMLEILMLFVMLCSVLAVVWKVAFGLIAEASWHGTVSGASMCVVAALRGRMHYLEIGCPVQERVNAERREAMRIGSVYSEVQITTSNTWT